MKDKESYLALRTEVVIKEIDSWRDIISDSGARYKGKLLAKLKKRSEALSLSKKQLERGLAAKPSFLRSLWLLFHMKSARAHINKAHRFF